MIGMWRWTFWVIRRSMAALYRPKVGSWPTDTRKPTVTLVSPVHNEDPEAWELALQSWIKNGVDEIIAVIDRADKHLIVDFSRRYLGNKLYKSKFKLVVQPTIGKRAGLCDGIGQATGDIIVLVDSDTIWSDDVLEKTLPFFLDPRMGGATITQRVYKPKRVADIIFDIMLWSRYQEEVPALLGAGKVFNTLSGRTAFYRREAIFSKTQDNIHNLRHEFFLGTRGISGDDKRLTHLILEQGWHIAYVPGPVVYTTGIGSVRQFFKQRIRWMRNMWRADLRAVFVRRWVWKHPALAIFRIDSFIQPFIMLIGPVVFVVALAKQDWLLAGILLAWWLITRTIKLFGYFRAHPARFIYLPVYIVYSYANALVKIYALATVVEHSWATRWQKGRVKAKKFMRRSLPVIAGTTAITLFVGLVVNLVLDARTKSAADVAVQAPVDPGVFDQDIDFASKAPIAPTLPSAAVLPTGVQRYTVQPGDNLRTLAQRFGMVEKDLKKLNGIRDPDRINVGQELLYYQPNNSQASN
jgi:hyaluronan synthase